MPAPSKYPRWATNDVQNPTSGEWNVVEPAEAKKDLGWDFKEYPPRQWFNWLARITNEWIEWFDSLLNQAVKTTSDVGFNSVTAATTCSAATLVGDALNIGGGDFTVDAGGNVNGNGDISLTGGDFVTDQGVEAATGDFGGVSADSASFGATSQLQINTSGQFTTDIVQDNTGADAKSVKIRSFNEGEDLQDWVSRCTFDGWTSWDVQHFRGMIQGGICHIWFWLEGDADAGFVQARVTLPVECAPGVFSYNTNLADPATGGDGFGHAFIEGNTNPDKLFFVRGGYGTALGWPTTGKKRLSGTFRLWFNDPHSGRGTP